MTHRPHRTHAWLGVGAGALLALLLALGTTGQAEPAAATGLAHPIVFTQLPLGAAAMPRSRTPGMLRGDYGERGRIVRVDPDGTLHVLTEGFASACGVDVSFDGKRILFAGKRNEEDLWNIWEMEARPGAEPRQVTRDAGNCRSPAYQATFYTIVSTEPWFQVMFTSDLAGEMNDAGSQRSTSVYSCRLDGTALRRMTMNPSDDMDPFLMQDGRVLVASWRRMDLRYGDRGRVSLFGVNADGCDYALYTKPNRAGIHHMPCETTGGLVVFVEAEEVEWDGAGWLSAVKTRRPVTGHEHLTTFDEGLYHSPSPLADGAILVSRRPFDDTGTHDLYRFDPATGAHAIVYADSAYHDIHAKILAPRPQPDGRSSVVNEASETGKLYCLNSTLVDPTIVPGSRLPAGTVRRLRVIEGVALDADGPGPEAIGIPRVAPRRLLGVVDVEEDGSFQIEVPADVPIQIQTLDENGMALFSCGWIWAKHKEPRGCIGCHEDPELTPENRFVLAVRKPPAQLVLPPKRRRTVDFKHDVMPIVARRCAVCHDGSREGLNLGDGPAGPYNDAYVALLTPAPMPAIENHPGNVEPRGQFVHPGRARTSPLVWMLHGRNTSRPWDTDHAPDAPVRKHPPEFGAPLTAGEIATIVEWIDLGALWDCRRNTEGEE